MDHGKLLDDVLFDRVTDDLCKIYVFTPPDGSYITWINHFTVEGWGVSREQIVEQAEVNIHQIVMPPSSSAVTSTASRWECSRRKKRCSRHRSSLAGFPRPGLAQAWAGRFMSSFRAAILRL